MAAKKNRPLHPVEGGPPPVPKTTGPQYDAVARMTKVETNLPVSPPQPPPTPPRQDRRRGARE